MKTITKEYVDPNYGHRDWRYVNGHLDYKYLVTKLFLDGNLKGITLKLATDVKYKEGEVLKTIEGTTVQIMKVEEFS